MEFADLLDALPPCEAVAGDAQPSDYLLDDLMDFTYDPNLLVPAVTPAAAAKPAVAFSMAAKPSAAARPVVPAKPKPAPAKAAPVLKAAPKPKADTKEDAEDDEELTFVLSSFRDHAMHKGMWAGALMPIEIPDCLGLAPRKPKTAKAVKAEAKAEAKEEEEKDAYAIVTITRHHTPALLKIIDEICVNAIDHATAQSKKAASLRVTQLRVAFDPASGRVTVYNDGPGIPATRHPQCSTQERRDVYLPEVAFAQFLAGTNINKKRTCVKGGTNGLGAKLASVHSVELEVETVDARGGTHYRQAFYDRLARIEPPVITSIREAGIGLDVTPHTRVSFVPAYAALGYKGSPLEPAAAADIDAWLRLRAHQAAAYLGEKIAVTYNGEPCASRSAEALGRLLLTRGGAVDGGLVFSGVARAKDELYKPHPWHIAAVVLPVGQKAGRRAAEQNMMLVNGVLSNKGSHVHHLKGLLHAAVDEKYRRVTKAKSETHMRASESLKNLRLVMCGAIPGADWGGQRKDELQVAKAVVAGYELPKTFLEKVASAVVDRLLNTSGKRPTVVHTKYTKAKLAGRSGAPTLLLAAEGDSAITFLNAGLSQSRQVPAGGPSRDYCGVISLQGVIVNAAREVTEHVGEEGAMIVRSESLQKNVRLLALADAFGLNYNCKYETARELATLKYQRLVLCVDQDLDGVGKIAALVLVWINLFWPALIKAGRVCRFVTPLVRAFRGSSALPVAEFYSEEELRAWIAADPARADECRLIYYKGLARHEEHDVARMFKPEAFTRQIHTYVPDDTSQALFRVYFGTEPALRKHALSAPVAALPPVEAEDILRRRVIPVGRVQLDIDTKSYKNDAIKRQIPSVVDGLKPVQRKVVAAATRRFRKEAATKGIKVFQLGGYTSDTMFYHHGDASINATITHMAHGGLGGRRYPYLVGGGQVGNRHGSKAGSPRYVDVRLSSLVRVVFPPADRWHLPYVFEDGERAEPQYFGPVVPMAVLESYRVVSEGWKHDSFAREPAAVLALVEAYIRGDPQLLDAAEALFRHAAEAKAVAAPATPPATLPDISLEDVWGVIDSLSAEEPVAEEPAAEEPVAEEPVAEEPVAEEPVAEAPSPALTPAALKLLLKRLAVQWPLPTNNTGYLGPIRSYRKEEYSFGAVKWDPARRSATVTDLPIGVYTDTYLSALDPVAFPPEKKKKTLKPKPAMAHIEEILNFSGKANVELRVRLKEGAYELLAKKHRARDIDVLEDLLQLRVSLRPHLNYYSAAGGVLEYGEGATGYLSAVLYWAHVRRELYVKRVTRDRIVAELKTLEANEMLRYIPMASELKLAELEDDDAISGVLKREGFRQLDAALLARPEYTPNEDLWRLVTAGPKASYDYIMNMRERDLHINAKGKLERVRDGHARAQAVAEAYLAESPVPCASIWLSEIEGFRKCVGLV